MSDKVQWEALVERAAEDFARLATDPPGGVTAKEAIRIAANVILDSLAPDPIGRDILRTLTSEIRRVI